MGNMGTKTYTDAERMRFLSKHGPEGFGGIEQDRNDLAMSIAFDDGREEITDDDDLAAFRMLVDMAIDLERRQQHIARLTALDKPTFERLCLVCIGDVPSKIEDLEDADLFMLSITAARVGKKS